MKWFLLSSILVFILAGCLLLMIDYNTTADAVQGVAGSFTSFGIAYVVYRFCDKRNLLPQ